MTRSASLFRLAGLRRLSLPLGAVMLLSGSWSNAGMIDKAGMEPWETCALCHGATGVSYGSRFPKLAGQKAPYIVRQALAFSAGKRTNDNGQMRSVLSELEPGDLEAIAGYFAALAPPEVSVERQEPSFDRQRYLRGRSAFYEGRADVPACAGCHANRGSSAPWLDTQHHPYLRKQLLDFRDGNRQDDADGVMREITRKLTEEDIDAVAYYLSLTRLERDL